MEWFDKTQKMLKDLMDTQKQMWENWTESIDTPTASGWQKTLKTWENSLNNFVEQQALWTRMWVRNLNANADIEGMEDLTKSIEEMSRSWVDAQQQMWGNWFEMMRGVNPEEMTDEMKDNAQQAAQSWQTNMQKMMDMQKEWASQWSSAFTQDEKDTE